MKTAKRSRIVVTGGAGFIGSHVVQELNSKGYKNLVIFDTLGKSDKWKNLIGKQFLDIFPKGECLSWLKGNEQSVQAIIHLGACTNTVEIDAEYLLENNYRFSVRLAEFALENQIRFIYASSAATYGNGAKGFTDDETALEQLEPLNIYGMSKHLFDLWLKNQGAIDQVTGLKYFNVFGPNEGHKGRMASIICNMVPTILKDKKVKLFKSSEPEKYNDGMQMRDFIYVKDVARMTCAFLETNATGIYNIGSGNPITWNELVTYIFSALKIPMQIEYIPMPQDLIGKYQNFSSAGDMKKTRAAIGELIVAQPIKNSVTHYVSNYLLPGLL